MNSTSKPRASSPQSASPSNTGTQSSGSDGRQGASSSYKEIGDEALEAARELKDRAAETAKELASNAEEKLHDRAEEQKTAGAERVSSIADAIRRAADAMGSELPQATSYVRRAATELETFSHSVRRRDVRELVRNVQDFARRNPTLFVGASVVAGIALVRFLKTSSQGSPENGGNERQGTMAGRGESSSENSERDSSRAEAGLTPSAGETHGQSSSGDRGSLSPEAPGFTPKPVGSSL
jgi:vacuolar-type H+-ATPase subunit H